MRISTVLLAVSISSFAMLGGRVLLAHAEPAAPTTSATDTIRIKAGSEKAFTDKSGKIWSSDKGFADGDVVERVGELKIEGTEDPDFYRTEHYDMTKFAQPVANGKYTVKLYFAETYEDVKAAGERVFSFDVEGQAEKDFDIVKEAGKPMRVVVKSYSVEVKDGSLDISFVAKVQATAVNGIEIIRVP